MKNMKTILDQHAGDVALVVGNGINRYGASSETNSWNDLLLRLANVHLPLGFRQVPAGVALTEFYDILELKSASDDLAIPLQRQFCELMTSWKPFPHHERVVQWAIRNHAPILTTNFEKILADAGSCKLRRSVKGGFTAYYPWESCYGVDPMKDPRAQFGIWHINGMERYRQSIRLGLTHYMGSVQRARSWLHRGKERGLFSGDGVESWKGARSWLQVVFNVPLLIFGLGLEENEVFLRWLLIERARYFRLFPDRKKPAWYVHCSSIDNPGKEFFLDGVGVQAIRASGYDEVYGAQTWG